MLLESMFSLFMVGGASTQKNTSKEETYATDAST